MLDDRKVVNKQNLQIDKKFVLSKFVLDFAEFQVVFVNKYR